MDYGKLALAIAVVRTEIEVISCGDDPDAELLMMLDSFRWSWEMLHGTGDARTDDEAPFRLVMDFDQMSVVRKFFAIRKLRCRVSSLFQKISRELVTFSGEQHLANMASCDIMAITFRNERRSDFVMS